MALMRALGINVSLGGREIFSDVSLEVATGEILAVLGPSGCGKTTLLRALARLTPIQSGHVEVPEDDDIRAGVRVVFQEPRLLPWLTVRGNIVFALQAAGVDARQWDARMDPLLEVVGLSAVKDRYPRQLSGGMAQRVALVRALSTRPRLLLLDEPFAALDPQRRERLQDELEDLVNRTQCAAVIVTHDVMEAVVLGDEVVILAGTIRHRFSLPQARPRGEEFRKAAAELASDVRSALLEVS